MLGQIYQSITSAWPVTGGAVRSVPVMKSPKATKSPSAFAHRTRLITILSIVGVAVAGAAAVAANVGILDSVADSSVNAGPANEIFPPGTQVVDVYLPGSMDNAAQEFAVEAAGTVEVTPTASGVALEMVTPALGWQWTLAQSDPQALTVTFTDGVSTLEFVATKSADGTIAASVGEIIVAPNAPLHYQDDCDDDDDDKDDKKDDDKKDDKKDDEKDDDKDDCDEGRDDDD